MGCFLLLEDGSGTLLLEDGFHLLQEDCVPTPPVVSVPLGGWAEQAVVRESEVDLVVAVFHATRRRRRLTVG